MEIQELKEKIVLDENIELILESLDMKHISGDNSKYYTCAMPDGDNRKSTIVYRDDNLHVDAYTRNIKDQYGASDLISLVSFVNGTYFSESIKWICEVCGYDYYGRSTKESKLARWIRKVHKESVEKEEDTEEIKPLDESVLKYFGRYSSDTFYDDGIDYETQFEFELGYDLFYHTISIPIRDELGVLCGVKGRLYKQYIKGVSKYFYIFSCPKSKILYGLHKTYPFIKEKNEVIVVESEKSVMQLWSNGIKNAIAISGHILSKTQVQKLTRLNVPVTIAYDQGAEIGKEGKVDKTFYPTEFGKFLPQQEVYCMYDKKGDLLLEKESPSDRMENFYYLYKNKIKVRG